MGEGGIGSEEEKEDEAKEGKEEENKEVEEGRRGGGGKEKGQEEEEAEREAKPESEKGKRREPGDKAEATVATAEGATLTTRNWSVPRETLTVIPTPELRVPPKFEIPELATYDTHTDTVLGGGGGKIHLSCRQHHTRGFDTRRLKRRNRF